MGKAHLIYSRLRPPIGIPLGFTLMYGAYTGFSLEFIIAGFGLFMLGLFGDLYNDYRDYDDDLKNNRTDKLTISGAMSKEQVRNISFLIGAAGIISLLMTNLSLLAIGLYTFMMLILYSHPAVRLKGKILGYMTLSTLFLALPFAISTLFGGPAFFTLLFVVFYYSQSMYILCQKDSTDLKDKKNPFLTHSWKRAASAPLIFGLLTSASLLALSFNPVMLTVWALNTAVKFLNMKNIMRRTITRKLRRKFITVEFLTPYLFIIGGLFG